MTSFYIWRRMRDYSGCPCPRPSGHQQKTLMFKFAPGKFVELGSHPSPINPNFLWNGENPIPKKMAENEGFEPSEPYGSTVFKTAAFDHSANSPDSLLHFFR